jgi:hypothetical protein
MKHRGEILREAVRQSGLTAKEITEKTKISHTRLYRMYKDPYVSFDELILLGKALRYNFANDFPELNEDGTPLNEPEDTTNYKVKYYELLEEHLKVLREKMDNIDTKKK